MKIEELVTNVELSKKLQEAGVDLPTPFWWLNWELDKWKIVDSDMGSKSAVKAYTFEQLWEVLPQYIKVQEKHPTKVLDGDQVVYIRYTEGLLGATKFFRADNLADAAAEALLWCLENEYITLEKVNKAH